MLIAKFAIASEGCALHPCKALQFGSPCLSLISEKITDFHSPLHLRKLARHIWRDSRNLSISPAATPRGGGTSVGAVSAVNPKRVMPALLFLMGFRKFKGLICVDHKCRVLTPSLGFTGKLRLIAFKSQI